MEHLSREIIELLAKKLDQAEATIKKNVSLLAHEYPTVTPNGRAQLYAKKHGKTIWGKLRLQDRQSLPNIEVQKTKITLKQRQSKRKPISIIEIIKYDTNDPLRRGHIDEINRAYTYSCYTSAFILCRKVIENMVIDILRKKFPESTKENKELYYDVAQKRLKDFSIILKNLRAKSNEFDLEKKLVERIAELAEGLKDKANDKTHSWFHLLRKPAELDNLDIQGLIDLIKRLEVAIGV